jgi:hypothetical protein
VPIPSKGNIDAAVIAAPTPPPGILLINCPKGLLTASNPLAVSIEPAIAFNGLKLPLPKKLLNELPKDVVCKPFNGPIPANPNPPPINAALPIGDFAIFLTALEC